MRHSVECRSEMCCTPIAGNTGSKNDAKIAICTPSRNFVGLYLRNCRHVSTIGKKLAKQQYVPHMRSQYGERRPTNGRDRFGSLGHSSKLQPGFASWLRYCSEVAQRKSTKLSTMLGHLLCWGGRQLYSEGAHHVGHRPTF